MGEIFKNSGPKLLKKINVSRVSQLQKVQSVREKFQGLILKLLALWAVIFLNIDYAS